LQFAGARHYKPLVSSLPILPTAIELADESATHRLAQRLADLARPSDVLALAGDLGLGKSSFARAFIRHFVGTPDEEVPSPTFTLVQSYAGPRGPVWHIDAYRLQDPDEAVELGLDEALTEAVLLIEWPDRLGTLLPADRLDVVLQPGPVATARRASLIPQGRGDWPHRLLELRHG
jgi:tRNA threonylcarbamoyladenosine biosynthesis protein TsaE